MTKRERDNMMLALLALTAWYAHRAAVAAEQAAILAASADDFDPTSWSDWKSGIRNVTVTKVIEHAGKSIIRKLIP